MQDIDSRIFVVGDNMDTAAVREGLEEKGLPELYQILVAGENFGQGVSSTHSVKALYDMGIRAIVAQSYAEEFTKHLSPGLDLVPSRCDSKIRSYLQTGDNLVLRVVGNDVKGLCKVQMHDGSELHQIFHADLVVQPEVPYKG